MLLTETESSSKALSTSLQGVLLRVGVRDQDQKATLQKFFIRRANGEARSVNPT